MRTLVTIFSAIIMLVTFSFAGPKVVDTEIVNANIIKGLTHANVGVVESSIRIAILMKIEYPKADYSDVIDELENLVMHGENRNIRIKALIATDYLNNFEQYKWLKDSKYSEDDKIFDAYINQMNFYRVAEKN